MNNANHDIYEEVRRRAENYFKQDYNCAQAVALSNLETLGGQTSGVMQLAAGFGHGMSAGCTCGAITGGVMAIGTMLASHETKGFDKEITEAAATLHREFVNEFGTTCCRGLRKKLSPYKNKKCREITAKTAVMTLELLLGREMTSASIRVQLL
jgi:C_GCAxxG_C_C family probable redox protein